MQIVTKFYEKEFSDPESKKAYLKACKWAAKHLVNTVEIGETFWRIVKVDMFGLPTFKLELFAMLEDNDLQSKFCDRCQEFHKLFYINQQYNCDKCNMKAFISQTNHKLNVKKQYRIERLNYIINKNIE